MRNFVFLLAFLLDGLTSSDAVSVSAQAPQWKVMELDGPWRIGSNRALQVAKENENDHEERHAEKAAEVVMHTLELSPLSTKNTKPMLDKVLEAPPVVKALEKSSDSPGATKKGFKSYLQRMKRWIVKPHKKAVKQYIELQTVLASTSGDKGYDKLMLLGHTPISWKATSDARGTKGYPDLPKYKPHDQETEFGRLEKFTAYFQEAINLRGEEMTSFPKLSMAYELLTPGEKQRANELVTKAEKLIKRGTSVDALIEKGVSPIIYLRVLIKNHDIYPEKASVSITKTEDEVTALDEATKNKKIQIDGYKKFVEEFKKKVKP